MNQPLIVTNSISINAPAEKVWDALTNPQQTKKYMFGCETVSDWKKGSPLLWKMQLDGKEFIAVKGVITEIDPGKFLSYTTIDPNSGIEDTPGNYLNVNYSLSAENGQTLLSVSQGDYSKVGDGEKRYQETVEGVGWTPILDQIKKLVESD